MSPVRTHPPGRSDSAVSLGRRQYPWNTCGPRISSSPDSPKGRSTLVSAGSTTRMSVLGKGTPTVPGRREGPIGLPSATGEVSVMP